LLIYQENFSILRFTHNLVVGEEEKNVKKVFIVLKGDGILEKENKTLTDDLTMFADRVTDFG
jgi:hypothetical protein